MMADRIKFFGHLSGFHFFGKTVEKSCQTWRALPFFQSAGPMSVTTGPTSFIFGATFVAAEGFRVQNSQIPNNTRGYI
jgi:hypothetical protein